MARLPGGIGFRSGPDRTVNQQEIEWLRREMNAVKNGDIRVKATGAPNARCLADRFAEVFNVKDYGAKGDNATNDTAAIQATINAAAVNGGTVFLPTGVYIVSPNTLVIKSGIQVVGAGHASVLKVVADAGDYRHIFAPSPTYAALYNVRFADFCFDQNVAANTTCDIRNGNDAKRQAFIIVYAGTGFVFDNVWFDAISGVNTVDINGAVSNVEIRGCHFKFIKGTTADPTGEYDNSAVYLEGTNLVVADNIFETTLADHARGAIEVHCGPAVVSGNVSVNYDTLVHVMSKYADPVVDTNQIVVSGNAALGCATGIRLWSATGKTLRGVSITGNTVQVNNADRGAVAALAANPYGAIQLNYETSGTLDGAYENIAIVGNTVTLQAENRAGYSEDSSGGIVLHATGTIKNVLVSGNTVRNSPSQGIKLTSTSATGASGCTITNNLIIDAGNNTSATSGYRSAFVISGKMTRCVIERNVIVDSGTSSPVGKYALTTSGLDAAADVSWRDNVVPTAVALSTSPTSTAPVSWKRRLVGVAAGATASLDVSRWEQFELYINHAGAFTIDNPYGMVVGTRLRISVINGTAGALGVATWGTAPSKYRMAAWVQPAANCRNVIEFQWDGGAWHEQHRVVDIPN